MSTKSEVWRWLLLLGPSLAILAAGIRSSIAPSALTQAALGTAVALLLVGWLTNRNVPWLPLVGAIGSILAAGLTVVVVATAMPPQGDDLVRWALVWIVLPLLYGIGLVGSAVGFVALMAIGPLAD